MEQEYRKGGQTTRTQSSSGGGYDTRPLYRMMTTSSQVNTDSSSSSFYPRIAQPVGGPPVNRPPPPPIAASNSSSSGTGIKVTIKPIYRVAPPVQLSPQGGEVPRSLFQFDFDLERRILAEAESQGQSFSRKPVDHSQQSNGGSVEDPTVAKYVSMGLNKEAVVMAIRTFGDIQNKVVDFCPTYSRLWEMGFQSDAVAAALATCDNDFERALAYLVSM